MNTYRSSSIVISEIPLVDDDGLALAPVSVDYRVTDESDAEILATTATSFVLSDTTVVISTTAIQNQLAVGKLKGLRSIQLKLTFDDQSVRYIDHDYMIEVEAYLIGMTNSYQTLGEAKLQAMDMLEMTAWAAAQDRQRESAMVEAFERIGRLSFSIYGYNIPSREMAIVNSEIDLAFSGNSQSTAFYRTVASLNDLSPLEFSQLPELFTSAVKRAQISEADIILGGDPIGKKREAGMLSDSIGESNIMFRTGIPLMMAVNRRTLMYMSGWISYNVRVGRN